MESIDVVQIIVNFHGQLQIPNCKLSWTIKNFQFSIVNCQSGIMVHMHLSRGTARLSCLFFPFKPGESYQYLLSSAAWLTSVLFTNYGNAVTIPLIICSWMYTVCHFKAWGKEIIDSTVCMLNNTPYQANFGLSENLSLLLIFAEKAQLELLDPR